MLCTSGFVDDVFHVLRRERISRNYCIDSIRIAGCVLGAKSTAVDECVVSVEPEMLSSG